MENQYDRQELITIVSALLYENPEPSTMHELSGRAYDMRCIARNALLEQQP